MRQTRIAAATGRAGLALLAATLLMTAGAQAQAPAPPSPGMATPFSMQPVEGGLMRLDTRTGAMSFCAQRAGGWTCEVVPDDRAALEAEIGRLQARIAALESGRPGARAGVPDIMVRPDAPPLDAPPSPPPPTAQAPTPPDADDALPPEARKRLDQAMDVAEHAFRRFFEMVERFREEFPNGARQPPAPPAKGEGL
ncbi:hypothetical protein [Ancylobacter sp.]|uniref:hypothetical protein n=1 Tax=Ancylobacter sp. TaxID=1872567 RepID=UPI003D13F40D